ncbi:MAG: sigma-70 family RNA polymerase sigma factor [bacterium]|nr:sigma-70 family RNA polymerase sigma factor [bacterium]
MTRASEDSSTTTASPGDRDLAAAQAGDPQAFARLVTPYRARLIALITRHGRDVLLADSDAEDLAQQVLQTAWHRLPAFEDRGEDSVLRWLATIARHAIHDRVRYLGAKGRRRARSATPSEFGHVAAHETSIPGRVHRRLEAERLQRALAELGPHQRDVVELHLLEARSLGDIAAELGISKNAAWERLRRGLLRLRDALRTTSDERQAP